MLLVTPGREQAIENIRKAALEGRFNDKTEPFDPQMDPERLKAEILRYVDRLGSPVFKLKNLAARAIVDLWRRRWSDGINQVVGMEKLSAVKGGAFITSNHFNPFDNGVLRRMTLDAGRGRLWAVSQGSNFIMPGLNGFVLRNIDVIPLIGEPSYMNGPFHEQMQKRLGQGKFILIYPEQEMWFNYRKPRPGKRGAFLFAEGFHDVRLVVHIFDPLWPDPAKSERQNSFDPCQADYQARVAAYERIYGKPLDYGFTRWDIAGWD